ncbi:NAD(P)/FAD-dependent oxidoreductase [Aquimarina sp. TRL1]|uniref:NAD(P)/FAD-dependent oxidoreductase n=1 Tax=Aquimarina sp. (strain TRL1) TaxID=2736252 RepID=UPI00158A3BA0|nr:NAD(P)/FAD-dependent oxidoreductase [Aquimarina sp. TRL1]QKX04308.1 NAD(P)/FAD-dependent oxidoreductase [Aquimarina sp. TRL1]
MIYDLIIAGGGAAGFFTAINVATQNPELTILIIEKGKEVLTKVKVSGGGRCNVTHGEFIPKELSKNYPRGEKELIGPFHTFMTGDTMEWFENKGVALKIEEDGRVFPVSDSSQTIIDCFVKEAKERKVTVVKGQLIKDFGQEETLWKVVTNKEVFFSKKMMVATGSNQKIWEILKKLNHTIVPSVPSLFTFNIADKRIKELPGVVANAEVKIQGQKLTSEGPLLITHWGMSGPAILKLSSWGALVLHDLGYSFTIEVNWLPGYTRKDVIEELKGFKEECAKQLVYKYARFELPKRLWRSFVNAAGIVDTMRWADVNKSQLSQLASEVVESVYSVDGKSTFKEEFVTAGGVDLKEVSFKTYESKKNKNLYFAGEVLNIDAITGGFNFQNAWTGAYIAAQAIAKQ